MAYCIRMLILAWKWVKWGFVVAGLIILWQAALTIQALSTIIPPALVKSVIIVVGFFLPVFLELIVTSLRYLWQPICIYFLITLLTKSVWWRKFWYLVGVAWCVLLLTSTFHDANWNDYQRMSLLMLQGYMFLLWLLPRELWNLMGLLVSSILGIIVILLPDLPTVFDDFGIFGAILLFFLGYLNALASLIQRVVRW
ncbi:hypothetical protein U27_06448 [Candidatus Vecturithrix granuli]|uniref:Uncharacterized protein n=1 Tax=Vecturithrix granuli TaxID=1499967 RepID=A0A081C4F8_VECG1|nr:hypothetical protein U27_06448 [Candidatus Vecturithrix granuli]